MDKTPRPWDFDKTQRLRQNSTSSSQRLNQPVAVASARWTLAASKVATSFERTSFDKFRHNFHVKSEMCRNFVKMWALGTEKAVLFAVGLRAPNPARCKSVVHGLLVSCNVVDSVQPCNPKRVQVPSACHFGSQPALPFNAIHLQEFQI